MRHVPPLLISFVLVVCRPIPALATGSQPLSRVLLTPLVTSKVAQTKPKQPGGPILIDFEIAPKSTSTNRGSSSRSNSKTSMKTILALWQAARESDSWRLVVRYPTLPGRIAATFERGAKRLSIQLSRKTQGKPGLAGRLRLASIPHAKARLSGRCIKIPERRFDIMVHPSMDARRAYQRRRTGRAPRSIRWIFYTRYHHDFDGDGMLDALVPMTKGAHCPSSVKEAIYIMRCAKGGCCGHFAGTITGRFALAALLNKSRAWPAPLLNKSRAWPAPLLNVLPDKSGLKPIVTRLERTERSRRIPDRVTYTRRYVGRKGRYVEVSNRRRAGRCHHCNTPPCSGPIRVFDCPLAHSDRQCAKQARSRRR
jgi:hypothetical protein